ncbi:MAG: right-handed parallel beta-helix repeat-containing protein, partial [Bacteroidia bacterium]|nr:right-handed parallel beta-helix repeat-containing protein [Bacteroidia bacterium]
MRKSSLFIILFFAIAAGQLHAKEFYVSPSGNASNTGTTLLRASKASDSNLGTTQEHAFATIADVREAVRLFTQTNTTEDVTVWLAGGSYPLTETQVFGLGDGAAPGQKIIYSAMPGETPVFNSDVPISGWTKVTTTLTGLPAAAVGKVWVAPLPAALTDFKVMFNSAGFLPRAQTNAYISLHDTLKTTNHYKQIELGTTTNLFYPSASNAEVSVIPNFNWTMNILPVQSFDQATGVVTLGKEASDSMLAPWAPKTGSVWIENTFSGMTKAGTWVLDKSARLVYYWPAVNAAPTDVVAPALIELFRIEGTIDYLGPTDIPVRGLVFRGLTFTHGNRYDASGRTGWSIQHDWERFDASTAMVRFRGAQDCAIENCKFVTSGGAGVRFDLYAQNCTVSSSEFNKLGGSGILFVGYGPGKKDVNKNNLIDNNVIHDVGQLFWQSAGIHTWQSGWSTISRNTIYSMPYIGIALSGRTGWNPTYVPGEGSQLVRYHELGGFTGGVWTLREPYLHGRENIVTDNDISDVLKVLYDGNGTYVSGTGRNNKFCRNYVHDVTSGSNGQALRCDGDTHTAILCDNIVFKCKFQGAGIISNGNNKVYNNIVAYPQTNPTSGNYLLETAATPDTTLTGSEIHHNILITNVSAITRFYGAIQNDPSYQPNSVISDYNLLFNYANSTAANAYLTASRALGYEKNSKQIDPMFVDPLNGDFRFKAGSPAPGLGIRELVLNPGSTLNKVAQTITFGSLASKIYGAANFALSATVSSGLPITYT